MGGRVTPRGWRVLGRAIGVFCVVLLCYAGWCAERNRRRGEAVKLSVVGDTVMVRTGALVKSRRTATLGIHWAVDSVAGRYLAFVSLPGGFKPGETLILKTENAREVKP